MIQDGDPARCGWQGFHQFGFSAGNGFLRAGAFGMHGADIGDHADLRSGQIAQEADLARDIKTHFQDGPFMSQPEFEQGERQPDLIIQVAGIFKRMKRWARTSVTTSLVVDLPTEPVMPITLTVGLAAHDTRGFLHCFQAVLHLDAEGRSGMTSGSGSLPLGQVERSAGRPSGHAGSAPGWRRARKRIHIIMPVHIFTRQGDEHGSRGSPGANQWQPRG